MIFLITLLLLFFGLYSNAISQTPQQIAVVARTLIAWEAIPKTKSMIIEMQGPGETTYKPAVGLVIDSANPTQASVYISGNIGDKYCLRTKYTLVDDSVVFSSTVCPTFGFVYVTLASSDNPGMVCNLTPGQSILTSKVDFSGGINSVVVGKNVNLIVNGKACMTPGQLCN